METRIDERTFDAMIANFFFAELRRSYVDAAVAKYKGRPVLLVLLDTSIMVFAKGNPIPAEIRFSDITKLNVDKFSISWSPYPSIDMWGTFEMHSSTATRFGANFQAKLKHCMRREGSSYLEERVADLEKIVTDIRGQLSIRE